jgi:hypothetical protein
MPPFSILDFNMGFNFSYTGALTERLAMKKTILATLLAASCASTLAANYYVVVPVQSRTATTGNILVTLNPNVVPSAVAGRAYAGFDFAAVLQVKGDPNFNSAGVTWYVTSGALPAGMSLSPDGKLSGTPTAAGTSSFQLQANYKSKTGQQGYQVVVGEVTVALAAGELPAGIQGAAYFYDVKPQLAVAGDPSFRTADVTWNFVGTLPPGLQLNTNGTITGVPTAEGTHQITVKATYLGKAGQQTYQVLVGAIQVSLSATASAPAGATYGQNYNAGNGWDIRPNLSVTGDAAFSASTPVTWTVAGGALPAGLTLNANGLVTGTPTARGNNPVQVKVEYKGKSATQGYTLPFTEGIALQSGFRAWSDGSLAASCKEYRNGKAGYAYTGSTGDGYYRIDVDGPGPTGYIDVLCDMTTDGGGWTVVQRRVNGTVDFYRTYAEYAVGFGTAQEYWIGNNRLATMTAAGVELRIDMMRTNLQVADARYSNFKVNAAADAYRLASASWVGGTAGDSLSGHVGAQFTTKDVSHDQVDPSNNCAMQYKGAWWYTACHSANLNGLYLNGVHTTYADGIEWRTWTGYYESLGKVEMKVR